MKEYFIYVDESGNTGSNLIDQSQPFLTFVGIGFDSDQVSLVDKKVKKLKKNTGYKMNLRRLLCFGEREKMS